MVTTETHRNGTAAEGIRIFDALMRDCARVIDLGCGERHQTGNRPGTTWVDIDPKFGADPRVLLMEIRDVPHAFRRMHFDAVLMTDVIEHLPMEDGWRLLKELEAIADRILIFTPLGELWIGNPPDRPIDSPHNHRSGWLPSHLQPLGYQCWSWPQFHRFSETNIAGAFFAWKWLKGEAPSVADVAREAGVDL